eukprot:3548349-Amphidinium_carterae.1
MGKSDEERASEAVSGRAHKAAIRLRSTPWMATLSKTRKAAVEKWVKIVEMDFTKSTLGRQIVQPAM